MLVANKNVTHVYVLFVLAKRRAFLFDALAAALSEVLLLSLPSRRAVLDAGFQRLIARWQAGQAATPKEEISS